MGDISKKCRASGKDFVVDDQDQAYYERIGVPLPTLCPDERQRRRMSWRNERHLYHRKCDLCNKQIISIYHSESPCTVYCNDCWWSDKWDPLDYGRDFDFSRSFFEQMHGLQLEVPRLALFQKNSINCDYTNHSVDNKNCYLCVDTADSENVYYSKWMIKTRDCIDCHNIENSELCYECQYQEPGYNNVFCVLVRGHDSAFLYNCIECNNCFMSSNLHRKQYYIYNQQYTKERYEEFMSKVDLGSYAQLEHYKKEFKEMIRMAPKIEAALYSCENCTGDTMDRCKDVLDSYEIIYSQDCRYCYEAGHMKDCYDVYESAFECELQYECHGCNKCQFLKFGHVSYEDYDCDYIDTCHNSHDLFGCVSIKRGTFCILNKQYSEEAYKALREKIILHMRATKEWGEFFPAENSPFAYNETIAIEYYPMSREEALAKGYEWREDVNESTYQGPFYELPDNIKETSDDVCKKILKCEASGKLYKIIPQELALHRKLGVALPRRCPYQRYLDRMWFHNARHLFKHTCALTGKKILAPYYPENGDTVYAYDEFIKMMYQ